MLYGSIEYAYAAPIADALETDRPFREWLIGRTRFADLAAGARLLQDEIMAKRSGSTTNWWRSHYTEKCRCAGCSGQETDIFAVFEAEDRTRFAVHVEMKRPGDRFDPKKKQAVNYGLRAECWVRTPPAKVLPHADATTMLICDPKALRDFGVHAPHFGSVVSFAEIQSAFPAIRIPTTA